MMLIKIISSFLYIVLDILLSFLSYLIPKKQGLIVFTSHYGEKYKNNSKYLFEYLNSNLDLENKLNEGNFLFIWATRSKEVYKSLLERNLKCSYTYSLKHIYYILRSESFVIDNSLKGIFFTNVFSFLGRFNVIQLWHGTGFKKIVHQDKKVNFIKKVYYFMRSSTINKVIASSECDKSKKQAAFINDNVIITGNPHDDIFFEKTLVKTNYGKKLNFKSYNKIILYAPTFRDNNFIEPFSSSFYQRLSSFLDRKNYFFLIKKHPYDDNFKVPNNYENIVDITPFISDVHDLLIDIDLLISDYSSLITSFIFTNKPILFYIYDYKNYVKNSREFYYDNLLDLLPGPLINNEDKLIHHIENESWFYSESNMKKYNSFKNKFHKFQNGGFSKRVFINVLNN